MNLSPAQTATFLTWLQTNAAALSAQDAASLANTPTGSGFAGAPALVATPYIVWNTTASKMAVRNAINAANFTPTDAAPASPSTDLTYLNRAILCQLKQNNAILITGGSDTIDGSQTGPRSNLHDCLTSIPAGTGGNNVNAGWGTPAVPGAVVLALQTPSTNFESLYTVAATGVGNDGVSGHRGLSTNPDTYGVDASGVAIHGSVSAEQVAETRGF